MRDKEAYKRTESVFDEVARKVALEEADLSLLKRLTEDCDFNGKDILEAGCGLGDNLIYCARKGARFAEGFDISGASIEIARSKVKESPPNIFFHTASVEDYKTKRKFDIILAIGIFEYLEKPFESLEKLLSLLNDKGTMIMVVSKPIFIKRISFLLRVVLSKIPEASMLPIARAFGRFIKRTGFLFDKSLSPANINTYTPERMVLEGLMVPRYNIYDERRFSDYLKKRGFSVDVQNDIWPSMVCITAKRQI